MALGLSLALPLKVALRVNVAEGEPEDEWLVLGVLGPVAHWLAVKLAVALPLREAEGVAVAVPRLAPAPPVALGLTVALPL